MIARQPSVPNFMLIICGNITLTPPLGASTRATTVEQLHGGGATQKSTNLRRARAVSSPKSKALLHGVDGACSWNIKPTVPGTGYPRLGKWSLLQPWRQASGQRRGKGMGKATV